MTHKDELEVDVSELTILDTESDSPVILVKEKLVDSPDSYAFFIYTWPKPIQPIRVKKLQEFALLPNRDERYKLLDVSETDATVKLPSGETVKIGFMKPGFNP
jgi:hypothetical protein